jgi:hypothetical protein
LKDKSCCYESENVEGIHLVQCAKQNIEGVQIINIQDNWYSIQQSSELLSILLFLMHAYGIMVVKYYPIFFVCFGLFVILLLILSYTRISCLIYQGIKEIYRTKSISHTSIGQSLIETNKI